MPLLLESSGSDLEGPGGVGLALPVMLNWDQSEVRQRTQCEKRTGLGLMGAIGGMARTRTWVSRLCGQEQHPAPHALEPMSRTVVGY